MLFFGGPALVFIIHQTFFYFSLFLIVKRVSIVVVVVIPPLGAEPTVTELLFGTAISTPAGVTTSMKKDLVAVFFSPPGADEKKGPIRQLCMFVPY